MKRGMISAVLYPATEEARNRVQPQARHLVPRVFFHKASREDSGYENWIVGKSRACKVGGKWMTFRKEHREKRPEDEVDPFTNIFDRKGIPFVYLLLTNADKWYPLPYL